jgi:hypothetical protein
LSSSLDSSSSSSSCLFLPEKCNQHGQEKRGIARENCKAGCRRAHCRGKWRPFDFAQIIINVIAPWCSSRSTMQQQATTTTSCSCYSVLDDSVPAAAAAAAAWPSEEQEEEPQPTTPITTPEVIPPIHRIPKVSAAKIRKSTTRSMPGGLFFKDRNVKILLSTLKFRLVELGQDDDDDDDNVLIGNAAASLAPVAGQDGKTLVQFEPSKESLYACCTIGHEKIPQVHALFFAIASYKKYSVCNPRQDLAQNETRKTQCRQPSSRIATRWSLSRLIPILRSNVCTPGV